MQGGVGGGVEGGVTGQTVDINIKATFTAARQCDEVVTRYHNKKLGKEELFSIYTEKNTIHTDRLTHK